MSTSEGSMLSNLSERLLNKGGTIHEITRNNTNGYFVAVRVISWIVLGRYRHQLFDKAGSARIAFWLRKQT